MSTVEPVVPGRRPKGIRGVLDTAASIAVLLAAGVFVWRAALPTLSRTPPTRPAIVVDPQNTQEIGSAPVLGQPTAQLTMFVYSDFQCPYCAQFAKQTLPEIRRTYIDTGKVLLAFKHFPLTEIHPFAMSAAQASVCAAEQGRFWQFHDLLFQTQASLHAGGLRDAGHRAGIDLVAYDACLRTDAPSVIADRDSAMRLQIRSTPTFLIGRNITEGVSVRAVLSGAQPFSAFDRAFRQVLESRPEQVARP